MLSSEGLSRRTVNPLTAPAFPSRTSLGPANFQSSARSRLGILPHPRRVALFEGEPRCGREHRLLDCPDELQKPGLPCAHYGEGRDHRHDAAVGDGRRNHGIRANSISPGVIETNQTREQLKDPEWATSRDCLTRSTMKAPSAPNRSRRVTPCTKRL